MLLDLAKSKLPLKRGPSAPFYIVLIFIVLLTDLAQAVELANLDSLYLDNIEKKYGVNAKRRLIGWQNFVKETQLQNQVEKEKLRLVNNFFNIYRFISDILHWNQEDYWATPLEFIVSGGGDCEDFAIVKYFTLIALNVPAEKLLITYVKALSLNQAHMVLTYYETPASIPLVLDNLIGEIKPASERVDLVPVYSFNGTGVWLWGGKKVGKSTDMNRWSDMVRRMNEGSIAAFNH